MSKASIASEVQCPICSKEFTSSEIEDHANRCLFLNAPSASPSANGNSTKRKSTTSDGPSPSRMPMHSTPVTKRFKHSESNTSAAFQSTKEEVSPEESAAACSSIGTNSRQVIGTSITLDSPVPLAEQVRPSELNSFVGQEKVLGVSSLLRRLLEKGDITSMVLWGPPGCGKTTLANIISCHCRSGKLAARFVKMSAVSCGVADVKEVVKVAKNELSSFKRRTILFMDEIHRFNKLQQDIFLPHVESGCIVLVGATTENPSFSLNSALLSRCRVLVLEKLSTEHITHILNSALQRLGAKIVESCKYEEIKGDELLIEGEALQWLSQICDGDARIAINSLQLAFQTRQHLSSTEGGSMTVTLDDIQEGIKRSHLLYDRKGDEHYNVVSAVHKSIRASDQNATLYWTARMLQGGEDPRFLARRLVRAASEDIGLADPTALTLAVATMQGCQLLGMPESDVLLAQCAVYLARAPKSREINNALARAKEQIAQHQGPLPSVPLHLRNAPTRLMQELGYGQGYSVDPSEVPDMTYMPEGMEDFDFF